MSMSKIVGCFGFLLSLPVLAADGVTQWSYYGENGPEHWGDLAPEFVQCKVGLNQSPIDIVNTLDADLPALELDYTTATSSVVNNGHTAQVNIQPGNYLRVGGEVFELKQFHLHTPSEHQINGKLFLMETHYVHANEAGELAVVALLHEEGAASGPLSRLVPEIPRQIGEPVAFEESLKNIPVVSVNKDYYRYNGSLTTPPCSEGVRWYVLTQPSPISREQQAQYQKLIGDDARGPQPVNARIVLE
ncbi:MAG: carbonic anhydrase family protein [Halioglobus sp.]